MEKDGHQVFLKDCMWGLRHEGTCLCQVPTDLDGGLEASKGVWPSVVEGRVTSARAPGPLGAE